MRRKARPSISGSKGNWPPANWIYIIKIIFIFLGKFRNLSRRGAPAPRIGHLALKIFRVENRLDSRGFVVGRLFQPGLLTNQRGDDHDARLSDLNTLAPLVPLSFFAGLSKPGQVSGGLGPAESGSSLLTALTSRLRVQDQTSATSRIYQCTPHLIRGQQLGVQLVP